jgi:oleandomycin transport system permease protein
MSAAAISPGRHLSPLAGLRQASTLTWRSVVKIKTNMEDVIGLTLGPIMFLLLFTYVFGGAVGGNTHHYLQFELPGILVMSVVFATLGTGLMLNQDINAGVFDRFRSLPIARWAPLAGAVAGDMVRYVISIAVTLAFGMVLGFRVTTNPLAAAAACLLVLAFAVAMCWIFVLVGMLLKTPQAVQQIGSLALFPLVFGSNLLVGTATMPGWLQAFVKVNPMTSLTTATRGLTTGGPVATAVVRSLLWAVGIIVVFAPLAVRAYRRRT